MPYVAFLTRVLGLRKDSLRDPGDGSVAVLLVMPCVASYAVGNRRVAIAADLNCTGMPDMPSTPELQQQV